MRQLIQKPGRLAAFITLVSLCVLSVTFGARWQKTAHAACPAPTGQYGAVNFSTVNVPMSGTYRLWVRINAPNATDNSVAVDVGSAYCGINMGDKADMETNQWKWVDYKAGVDTNKANLTLTAGAYTLALSGREPNVSVDRVLLVADTTCTPIDDGSNCLTDVTPPTVSLTSPTAGRVTGTVNIAANAADARGVTKVEFYANGELLNTDTVAPYSYAWDTTKRTNQDYTITAKAYDTSGNTTSSSSVVISVANLPTVAFTSPVANSVLTGTITLSATASSQTGIAKVEFLLNNISIGTITTSPYNLTIDTRWITDGAYTLVAKASDNAGVSATASIQAQILNQIAPVSVVAVEDSMVKDGKTYVGKNFDTLNRLRVSNVVGCTKNCGTQYNRKSYLKFNVSGVKTAPKSITLRLYVSDTSADGGSIYKVDNNTWSESALTWTNAPAIGTQPLGSIGAVKSGQWIDIAINPATITSDGIYSFAIVNNSGDVAGYMSTETNNKPTLNIKF